MSPIPREKVRSIVISTTDLHVLTDNHITAIRNNLDQFRNLQNIEFVVYICRHNAQDFVLGEMDDDEGKIVKVGIQCDVSVEEVKTQVTPEADLAQAIYLDLYDKLKKHLVLQ